jgi:predicted transcriptional regulator
MVPLLIEAIHDLEDQIEDLSAPLKEANSSKDVTMDRLWSELQSLQQEVRRLQESNQWLQTLNRQLMEDIAVELLKAVPSSADR